MYHCAARTKSARCSTKCPILKSGLGCVVLRTVVLTRVLRRGVLTGRPEHSPEAEILEKTAHSLRVTPIERYVRDCVGAYDRVWSDKLYKLWISHHSFPWCAPSQPVTLDIRPTISHHLDMIVY